MTTTCPECSKTLLPKQLGPHISGHRRTERAKYRYLNGDIKHPYELKACKQCGDKSWIQTRRDFCSRRCSRLGKNNPAWIGDKVGYLGRHARVYKARGPAASYTCEECPSPAREWAQTHGTTGISPGHYRPLCKPCHSRYDHPRWKNCKRGHPMHLSKSGKSWYCLECVKLRRVLAHSTDLDPE